MHHVFFFVNVLHLLKHGFCSFQAKTIIKQVKKESVDTSEVTDLQSKTHAKAEEVSNDTADNCKSDVIGSSTALELDIPKVINIDSDEKDPLLCCLYAPEIYHNLRVSEVIIP